MNDINNLNKEADCKKFIFLDIDGVLNSVNFLKDKSRFERVNKLKEKIKDEYIAIYLADIDPKKVELLNKITESTGAKIVVSSSWRSYSGLQTVFTIAGIKEPVYDQTPRLSGGHRGQEIQQWLDKHKCDKYVILDDDQDFFDSQLPYFVHTDWKVGLTENDVNKAVNILNK